MKARRSAALIGISAAALTSVYGCASVLGIDHEYVDDRGSGGSSPVTSSSGGGAGPACASEADCPADTDCATYTCVDKQCYLTLAPAGAEVAAGKVPGDCKRKVCSGNGTVSEVGADDDPPVSPNPCTTKSCAGGEIVTTVVMDNEPCGQDQYCQAGVCIGCQTAADCGPPPACYSVACQGQQCVVQPAPAGYLIDDAVNGNCKALYCDGTGNVVEMPDDNDEPQDSDATDCVVPNCVDGSNVPTMVPDDAACGPGGGRKCCNAVCCRFGDACLMNVCTKK